MNVVVVVVVIVAIVVVDDDDDDWLDGKRRLYSSSGRPQLGR